MTPHTLFWTNTEDPERTININSYFWGLVVFFILSLWLVMMAMLVPTATHRILFAVFCVVAAGGTLYCLTVLLLHWYRHWTERFTLTMLVNHPQAQRLFAQWIAIFQNSYHHEDTPYITSAEHGNLKDMRKSHPDKIYVSVRFSLVDPLFDHDKITSFFHNGKVHVHLKRDPQSILPNMPALVVDDISLPYLKTSEMSWSLYFLARLAYHITNVKNVALWLPLDANPMGSAHEQIAFTALLNDVFTPKK